MMPAFEHGRPIEIVTFTGGTGGSAMTVLSELVPGSRVTMAVSTADGGNCTNDIRRMFHGPAVGDLRKVMGYASTNGAGLQFLHRFEAGDTLDAVRELNERFLGGIAVGNTQDTSAAEAATRCVIDDIAREAIGYRTYGLGGHTYGNFILTALRFHYNDDLMAAAETANRLLKTRATVLPVTTQSYNLVLYDRAAGVVAYGEGAADTYILKDPAQAQLWLERGETRNFIEDDPRKVRRLVEWGQANDCPRPQAADEVLRAVAQSACAFVGPGSPLTSGRPAIQPEGVPKALNEQCMSGGEWVMVTNGGNVEKTTPGLTAAICQNQFEMDANRRFDHVIAGASDHGQTVHRLADFLNERVPQGRQNKASLVTAGERR